jgi:hypothetical protein
MIEVAVIEKSTHVGAAENLTTVEELSCPVVTGVRSQPAYLS